MPGLPRPLQCLNCSAQFSTVESYQAHHDTVHASKPATSRAHSRLTTVGGAKRSATPYDPTRSNETSRVRFIRPSTVTGLTRPPQPLKNSGNLPDASRLRRFRELAGLFRTWAPYAPTHAMTGAGSSLYPEIPLIYVRGLAMSLKAWHGRQTVLRTRQSQRQSGHRTHLLPPIPTEVQYRSPRTRCVSTKTT